MPLAFNVEKVATGSLPFRVRGPDDALAVEINEFLEYLVTRGRSPYTLRSYAAGLAHFFGWLAERGTEVNHVSRQFVGEYIANFSGGPKIDPRIRTGVPTC